MLVDNVGRKICLLGDSNSMVTLTVFPWCKLLGLVTSSTTNRRFYRVLEQLHGPWRKQPVRRAIQRAMTRLIFVDEVGKLGGGMWL